MLSIFFKKRRYRLFKNVFDFKNIDIFEVVIDYFLSKLLLSIIKNRLFFLRKNWLSIIIFFKEKIVVDYLTFGIDFFKVIDNFLKNCYRLFSFKKNWVRLFK